jgi:hypothetical protein
MEAATIETPRRVLRSPFERDRERRYMNALLTDAIRELAAAERPAPRPVPEGPGPHSL